MKDLKVNFGKCDEIKTSKHKSLQKGKQILLKTLKI